MGPTGPALGIVQRAVVLSALGLGGWEQDIQNGLIRYQNSSLGFGLELDTEFVLDQEEDGSENGTLMQCWLHRREEATDSD